MCGHVHVRAHWHASGQCRRSGTPVCLHTSDLNKAYIHIIAYTCTFALTRTHTRCDTNTHLHVNINKKTKLKA